MSSVSQADFRCNHGDTICGEFNSRWFLFTNLVDLLLVHRSSYQLTEVQKTQQHRLCRPACLKLPHQCYLEILRLCVYLFAEIRVYEQEVIIVPTLLLASFLVTVVFIFLLRFCPEKVDKIRPQASKPNTRRVLQGIDGMSPGETKMWKLWFKSFKSYLCPILVSYFLPKDVVIHLEF